MEALSLPLHKINQYSKHTALLLSSMLISPRVPNLSLTVYPSSVSTDKHVPVTISIDEHVPLKFLMTKYFIMVFHMYI